jgi:diguanylate cyclase (GGDEF)-like protein
MGHHEGDNALVNVATILMDTFRSSDIIARIGGDEFVVLQMKNPEDPLSTSTKRLQENLVNHNLQSPKPYDLSLSIGAVIYKPEQPKSLMQILAEADTKMYAQKKLKNSKPENKQNKPRPNL